MKFLEQKKKFKKSKVVVVILELSLSYKYRKFAPSIVAATSHMWLLSIWNMAPLNWEVLLSIKYTLDFKELVWKE